MLRGKYRIPFYMSTDCENLLKKFLILNPSKRGSLEVRLLHLLSDEFASPPPPPPNSNCFPQQQIMRDRWMNVGYEEEELKPYIEPQPDYKDPKKTGRKRTSEMFDSFLSLTTPTWIWAHFFV